MASWLDCFVTLTFFLHEKTLSLAEINQFAGIATKAKRRHVISNIKRTVMNRTNFHIIVFIIFINSFVYSQEIEFSEQNINEVLCKDWILESLTDNGEVIHGDFVKQIIKFEINKTYTKKTPEGIIKDRWRYNESEKYIEIFTVNKVSGIIKKISTKKLILQPISINNRMLNTMEGFELHFIPLE